MPAKTTRPAGYSSLQKLLHWLVALMVFIMLPVGFYMVNRGKLTNFDAFTNQLYTMHKSFGFVLLWVIVLRIVITSRRGSPAPEASLSPLQIMASRSVHLLLYALLLIVPVLGWAGVSAYPATGALFGLNLPSILPVNPPLAEKILMLHGYGALLMVALIAMHIGAALMHAIVLKDGVLRRMLP